MSRSAHAVTTLESATTRGPGPAPDSHLQHSAGPQHTPAPEHVALFERILQDARRTPLQYVRDCLVPAGGE